MDNSPLPNRLRGIVAEVTKYMRLQCQVEVHEETLSGQPGFLVSIYAPEETRFLIGRNGQNLQALEHIVRVICAREEFGHYAITLDVNDYRKTRAAHATETARLAVSRVRDTQKPEALAPMSSYERRIVHMELAACSDVATESIGEEPQRRVVIKPFP